MTRMTASLLGFLAAALLAVGTLVYLRHRDHERNDRAREAAISALHDTLTARSDSLARSQREAETAESAYSIAALAYRQARGQFRIVHSIDTMAVSDTVYLAGDTTPHPIPLAVGLALDRCDRLARDCAQMAAAADTLLRLQARQILTLTARSDSLEARPTPPRLGLKTGVAVGAIGALLLRALLQ